MAFQLGSIHEVITPEAFEALKSTIELKKNQKAPSTALPRRAPASMPSEQLKLINSLLDTSYENCDWLVYSQSAIGIEGMGISRSELVTVRLAVSTALACTDEPSQADALAQLVTCINKHPTFGDLYLGLAGLKLLASQIDAAHQLTEIAQLCPRYHKAGVACMKQKIDLMRPEWKYSVQSWVCRYAEPSKFEILTVGVDAEITEKAMPAIEQIRADPSNAFVVWQTSPEFRAWADKVDDNAAKARVVYPITLTPQENPLISLDPKITAQILNYLDLTSVLALRPTCKELCTEVSYSLFWKDYIERMGFNFDALPGYMTEVPMAVFSGLRSVVKMGRLISGPSPNGPLAMDSLSSFALEAADELIEVTKGLNPGAPWQDLAACLFAYRLQALACIDPSGKFMEYLEDEVPSTINTLFRLLRLPNPIAITCALQLILFTIVTKSPRRKKWVAQYRHMRLIQHLSRFGLHRQTPFSQISAMLYAALEAADFIDADNYTHDLKMDAASPKLEKPFASADFDGIWYISQVGSQLVGIEGVTYILCCDLKWELENDKITVKGPAFASDNLESTIDGSASATLEQLGFQLSSNDGSFSAIYDAVIVPVGIGGTASRPEDLAEGGGWNPIVGFHMWRDTRPSTPEHWEEAKKKVLASACAPPAWFSEDTNDANRAMMATSLSNGLAHTAGCFAPWTVVEQASAPYEVPGIREYAADPSIPSVVLNSLSQSEFETDNAYATRQELFLGASSIIVVERLNIIPAFAHELDDDSALIVKSVVEAYGSLPDSVLLAAGVIIPSDDSHSSRRLVMQALDANPTTALFHICQQQLRLWCDPKTKASFLGAASLLIDAVVRTGITNPSGEVFDFDNKSPINTLYHKWTCRLTYTHPSVDAASPPFSFEELYASMIICQQRMFEDAEAQQADNQQPGHAHATTEDSQQIFSDALKRKSRKSSDNSTMITSALIIAGATVATLAIGVGAFLLGRRLTNQD